MDKYTQTMIDLITRFTSTFKDQVKTLDDFYGLASSEIRLYPLFMYDAGEEHLYAEDLHKFLNMHIQRTERLREQRKMQADACVRNGERVGIALRNMLKCFTDEDANMLKQLIKIAEAGDDKLFILVYKETVNSVGIVSFSAPHLLVCDCVDSSPYYKITYDHNKGQWVKSEEEPKNTYQLSDIYDNLTVGKEMAFDERDNDHKQPYKVRYDAYIRRKFGAEGIENCEDYILHNISEEAVDYVLAEMNKRLKRIRTCHNCKNHFILADTEIAWFEEKKFKLPNNCADCRKHLRWKRESYMTH